MRHNDGQLLTRVRAKDAEAMAEIYDRYAAVIYSMALYILNDPKMAERVAEETLLDVWRDPSCAGAAHALGVYFKAQALCRALRVQREKQTAVR
jgi:RNA polymerase sigma-70 factor (ECF subfamily)